MQRIAVIRYQSLRGAPGANVGKELLLYAA
jgi:hypothetical protein